MLFLIAFAEIIYIFQGCDSSKEDTKNQTNTVLTDADYAGSESCQSCHQKEYNDWQSSHHDLAMMKASEASVKGNFNITFTSQGVTNTFFKKGDQFFVNTEGPDGTYQDYEIMYTFGVTPLQQYLIQFPGGRLQCLRTAWDTEKNQWFDLYPNEVIAPDEWLHWTKGGLNWNTMCSDCHSTNVHKNFNEETETFNTTFSIINVSCESCHGPAKEHVRKASSPGFDSSSYDPDVHLYLTSAISPHEQVDQCARCHSRRVQHTNAFSHQGEFMDHYTPEVLRDDLYYPDGQILDEVYVYGSFVQSKMYKMNVKCSDCHNPHSLELKFAGNTLCNQCHVPAVYDTPKHHFHPMNTASSQCINCHMPGRTYMGNDFRRDHSFRIPRPDMSVIYATPNACNQCHEDKSNQWASDKVNEWYGPDRKSHYSEILAQASTRDPSSIEPLIKLSGDTTQPAIARATAIWYLDQQPLTQEHINAIIKSLKSRESIVRYRAATTLNDLPEDQKIKQFSPLLKDEIRSVRIAAAYALSDVPVDHLLPSFREDFNKAIQEFKTSLVMRADFPGGQFEKGIYYERTGQLDSAELAYQKALELDNYLNMARSNLAHLYSRRGNNGEAIDLFKTIIEQEPNYGMAYYSLGLLYAEEGNLKMTIEYLTKAIEREANPRIYYNLALAYQQSEDPEKAEKSFLKGLELAPGDDNLMYALSILYLQQEQPQKAKSYLEKLAAKYPGNAQIQQMLGRVNQGL